MLKRLLGIKTKTSNPAGLIQDNVSGDYHNLICDCGATITFMERMPVDGSLHSCPHCTKINTIQKSGNSFIFK